MTNAALDIRRRDGGVFSDLDEEELLNVAESQQSDTDGDQIVRRAISRLPHQQRLAVFLRYFVDLDYQTIAEVLGVQAGTVAATLHTARATIGREIEEAKCRI